MKHLIYIIFLFLPLFSCRSEIEQAGTPKGKEIAFSALQSTSLTRATDTGFNTGDEIGIFVVQRTTPGEPGTLKPSGNFADNKRYRIDSNGQLRAASEVDKIYFQPKELYDIYAYYPYAPGIDPTNYKFNVNSDQTGNSYTRCDLMTAIETTGLNQSNISLWFRRKFACVEVSLAKSPDTNITTARLNRVKNAASLNLGTNSVTTLNDSMEITMNLYEATENNYKFRAIIPVQTLNNDLFTFINNGEVVTYKATAEKPLAEGVRTPYNLEIRPRTCRINIECYPSRNTLAPYLNLSESANYSYNSQVHLYGAIDAVSGYVFAGWFENGNYLHRKYGYDFTATSNRTLTAKFYIGAYQVNMSGGYETVSTPGYHTRELKDYKPNSIYLRAGQSIQQMCDCFYAEASPEDHSLPIRITKKELRITRGSTEILTTNDFAENYIFTATQAGTYTFTYYMSIDFTLLENERTAGTLSIYRLAWYLD